MENINNIFYIIVVSGLLSVYCDIISSPRVIKKDYCTMDMLHAKCHHDNQVILMTKAYYGRMNHKSHCIKQDYSTGCRIDVLKWVDNICSGHNECEVKIPDDDLHAMNPCGQDFQSYLEVEYICQTVKKLDYCNDLITISDQERGFLHYPEESEVPSCDIRIHLSKGQRLNITLYDFGLFKNTAEMVDTQGCVAYGYISESTGPRIPICGGNQRFQHIYQSAGNEIYLSLNNPRTSSMFLLAYQVSGCGLPEVTNGVTVDIEGVTATATCNITGQKTHLICRDNHWVGDIEPCMTASHSLMLPEYETKPANMSFLGRGWNSTVGLIIVVALGVVIGATVGVAALVVFALCYRKVSGNPYYSPTTSSSRYYTGRDSKMYLHLAPVNSTVPHPIPHSPGPQDMRMKIETGHNPTTNLENFTIPIAADAREGAGCVKIDQRRRSDKCNSSRPPFRPDNNSNIIRDVSGNQDMRINCQSHIDVNNKLLNQSFKCSNQVDSSPGGKILLEKYVPKDGMCKTTVKTAIIEEHTKYEAPFSV